MNAPFTGAALRGAAPSVLDLVRLSRRPLFPPGGRPLYQQIGILTGMGEGDEVLVAGCGGGVTLAYFAREFGVQGTGVDEDEVLLEVADSRGREAGLAGRLQYEAAEMHDLPYRDEVFDVVVGELGLATNTDPSAAVRELARVLKPGGRLALVQLVWAAPVEPERRGLVCAHLGVHLMMRVELKRILRDAGIERLRVEVWSGAELAFGSGAKKPLPDFAKLFSPAEKLAILRRAWRRWGWRGVWSAVARIREVQRLMMKDRILSLDMVAGVKGPRSPSSSARGAVAQGVQAVTGGEGR